MTQSLYSPSETVTCSEPMTLFSGLAFVKGCKHSVSLLSRHWRKFCAENTSPAAKKPSYKQLQTECKSCPQDIVVPGTEYLAHGGFLGGTSGKESVCQGRRCRRCRFDSWVRKIPWRRTWQLTPVFLPGKSHGQKSLAGYSPWCLKRVRCNLATKQQ